MRNWIIVFIPLLYGMPAVGQLQPIFQTTLYFEDAIGNRDSIVVGLDTLANPIFNPGFGEEDIASPFDSVFEVRATHWGSFGWGEGDYILSKKIIGDAESNDDVSACYVGGATLFFIHAKYQPVRISWAAGIFNNYCMGGSFFTPDRMHQMVDPWDWLAMPAIRFGCASGTETYEIALGDEYCAPLEISYIAMQEIEGSPGILDSIYGVAFGITNGYFIPCSQLPVYGNPRSAQAHNFRISPNPAQSRIRIVNQEDIAVSTLIFYNHLGKMVAEYPAEPSSSQIDLDISQLASGIYLVVQRFPDGRTSARKWVKM